MKVFPSHSSGTHPSGDFQILASMSCELAAANLLYIHFDALGGVLTDDTHALLS